MKKICISVIFLALFLVSCQVAQPPLPSSLETTQLYLSNGEETSGMKESSSSIEPSSTIIWIEEGDKPILDEAGVHPIGTWYREVDLSEPVGWSKKAWDEVGIAIEPRSDLTQILGQSISTKDDAAYIANKVLASEQEMGCIIGGLVLELTLIKYDPGKNIWIFVYGDISRVPGSNFCVAVNGESGELIRMWVE